MNLSVNDLSLYIHVPFCFDKCDYCDFFSIPHHGRPDNRLLEREFRLIEAMGSRWLRRLQCRSLETIYIGGGTPSSIGLDRLERLLSIIANLIKKEGIAFEGEYTMEANPRDISNDLIELLESYKINRLSLGLQSLNDRDLRAIGRSGSRAQSLNALSVLSSRWKGRFSLDIIAGIPGQKSESIDEIVETAAESGADHLSIYQLTIEEGTPLARKIAQGLRRAPQDEDYLRLFKHAVETAEKTGFKRYEVSAFARKGCESKHNLRYWYLRPYLGLGSGAVSTLPLADGRALRFCTGKGRYMKEILSHRQRFTEALMTGFRLVAGVDESMISGTGIPDHPFRLIRKTITDYRKRGLLFMKNGRMGLTHQGLDLLDRFLLDCLVELDITWPENRS